jgi:hypothetical protein
MADITTINFEGDDSPGSAGARIKQALDDAINNFHQLSDEVMAMEGMSGKIYRKLINNLIRLTPDARYLETGSLKGSTACSAMYKNKTSISCIENWHWDWRKEFHENINSVLTDDINFQLIEKDFRSIDYSTIGKYNVYMFDGPHSEKDQYDGVVVAQPALDDTYVLIVDDWNWAEVQDGTWGALSDLGHNLITKLEIRTTDDFSYPKIADHFSDWHNGYLFAVIEKG